MAKPVKILYIITKSNWGGAQRYVYDLTTNLSKDRFEVTVAAGGNGPLLEKLQAEKIRTISLPHLQKNINFIKELSAFFYLLKVIFQEKPDIIHLNSTKAGLLGGVASFMYKMYTFDFNTKVIFTVHGWVFKENRNFFQKIVLFKISWFSSLFFDKLILIDEPDMLSARKFIPHRKLVHIPNGIEKINFLPRPEARERLGNLFSEKNCLYIGTVAELTLNKGLTYLIKAADLIKTTSPNLSFKMVIGGDGTEIKKLESEIHKLQLTDTVYLAGHIPEAKIYLKAFDIFILSSLKEGLPYTLLEAMQAGLPIIATKVGGVSDLITNNEQGVLIPPQNPLAISEAVLYLLSNPEKMTYLGKSARIKAEQKYNILEMLKNTVNLYDQKK